MGFFDKFFVKKNKITEDIESATIHYTTRKKVLF